NLVAKPYATIFGGGLTELGVIVGLATYHYNRSRRPAVFPVPYTATGRTIEEAFRRRPAEVLVLLPRQPAQALAVIQEGIRAAAGPASDPRETVAAEEDDELLPPIALERVRRHLVDGQVVLHMVTGRHLRAAAGASSASKR